REVGFCSGIENYSRHIDGRGPGTAPYTLLDYFPDDFLVVIDESHVTVPQLHGMYEGDISRKTTLVDFGFRLPSAIDNRPLRFEEFVKRVGQVVFMSAKPGDYELRESKRVVEQIVRPTGLIDPEVQVRPTKGQVDDLIEEIRRRAEREQRVLVTTLTKKMAEDLTDYLIEMGIRVRYLHSEVDTLQRIEIVRDLRLGEFDASEEGAAPEALAARDAAGRADATDPDARGGDASGREGPPVRIRRAVARRGRRSPEGAEAAPRRRGRRVTSLAIRAPEAWLGPVRFTRDALVVCEGGKVSWAGRERDAAAAGIGAERILEVDGFMMPAAADRHVHIELADPAAVLLRGVTAVRDLAWPADRI